MRRNSVSGAFLGFVVASANLAACGVAGWVVKKPVSDQCASTGLQKCDELTDAVVQYASGDKLGAEPKLRAVAHANQPEKLKAFANALKPVAKTVGGEQGSALSGVADILLEPDGVGADGRPSVAEAAAPTGTTPAPPSAKIASTPGPAPKVEAVRTGMARPAMEGTACESGPLAGDQARCRKVLAIGGPFTVTNLYASGGCPDELFVFAGHAEKPHWFVSNLPNVTLNFAGHLAVDDGEDLFVGVRAAKDVPKTDSRCTVVWSGAR